MHLLRQRLLLQHRLLLLLLIGQDLTSVSAAIIILNVRGEVLPFDDRLLGLFRKADSGATAFADHWVGEDFLLANNIVLLLFIVINAIVV